MRLRKMDLNECIRIIEDLIKRIEKIIEEGAKTDNQITIDKYRDVAVQLQQLMRTFFNDAENRIGDYNDSINIAAGRDNWRKTGIFLEQAKVTKRYLNSIKDSIKLRMTTKIKEDKLDILKKETEEKSLEAKRRGTVVETKIYGAAMEMIDKLRGELKNNKNLFEEIITIKRDLKEIKDNLNILLAEKKNLNIEEDIE